jgi:hypothetical protein
MWEGIEGSGGYGISGLTLAPKRVVNMKRIYAIMFISLAFVFLFNLNTFAQKDNAEHISIILPTESIARFVTKLLPYEINLGENSSGSLFIKSINNIKIEDNKISFSLSIYGKDITYSVKMGQQTASIEIGSVNLLNDWESSIRFDVDKKVLYIKPHLKKPVDTKKENYNEILINSIFIAFSDIEYPVDLQEIDPITTEIMDKLLTVNIEILNIYAANNKMTIEFRPIPHISDKNKIPVENGN